ncbi:MAG: SGNH/GDSL hydrolase family protein [Anaerolineae bacterium]|nr:SGNH/GDSL hydrolase family protein [Anaerolineae bacterium]
MTDPNRAPFPANTRDSIRWHDVREWGVEGQGWTDNERYYSRLPRHARSMLDVDIWNLGQHSAGMYTEFVSDATEIYATWKLLSTAIALPHMPATSVSGIDLYAQDVDGQWKWVAVGRPETSPDVELLLVSGLEPGKRRYRLYLPLYNGIEQLRIGVHRDAEFVPVSTLRPKPIVVYGTSIVQGCAASRAGMCHAAILGRWLDRPILNLGFSGRGKMEFALAELLGELDASVYVIDCLPNMEPELIAERAYPFIAYLRRTRPLVPMVLVEDRSYSNSWVVPKLGDRNRASRDVFRRISESWMATDGLVRYVPGDGLLGGDGEATVDGSHPTDLGFMRMAERLRPVLRALI